MEDGFVTRTRAQPYESRWQWPGRSCFSLSCRPRLGAA